MVDSEAPRLAALHSYCVLDTPPDKLCDQLTSLACSLFGVDISLVSLGDEGRQWFKSRTGLQAQQSPRVDSFCAHAIQGSETLVVLDAQQDARFANNMMVTGAPFIRFYAGVPLRIPDGHAIGTLCIIGHRPRKRFGAGDVARLEQLAAMVMERLAQLRSSGCTDYLTGLPNRARFVEDLRMQQHAYRVSGASCSAIAVDICPREYLFDMVKALGWDYAEDFVVKACAEMRSVLGGIALYRIATTTFAYVDAADAQSLCERISALHRQFAAPREIQGIPHRMEIAVGRIPHLGHIEGGDVVRSLLTVIDVSRAERVSPRVFEQTHAETQRYSFWLLSALPQALTTAGELSLHYQPKIYLSNGKCAGVEALIRWNHPILGNIAPAMFMALAEKTALMGDITSWVVRTAVAQAAQWAGRGHPVKVAFNTSARDFDSDTLGQLLKHLLAHHALPPELIEIEFTESAMARDPEQVRERILAIKQLGVTVAIDDFGAGFSNLSYMKNIPADTMKIDQSFIRGMVDDEADQMIVPSIIHLAHNLGYTVVAEGVETEHLCRILKHLGCDYAQGYAIARPMSAADFEHWAGIQP